MNLTNARWPVLAVALVCGCASDDSTSDAGSSQFFLAFAQSFNGFHSWYSVPALGPPGLGDAMSNTVHTMQPLIAYINHVPPHGSTSFPIGTIIVKEVDIPDGDPTTPFFAMVKRGGGFNAAGALNWEWFELQNTTNPDLPVNILWRGYGPPTGESYGGNPDTCNQCHGGAKANDYVWTQDLQLSSF